MKRLMLVCLVLMVRLALLAVFACAALTCAGTATSLASLNTTGQQWCNQFKTNYNKQARENNWHHRISRVVFYPDMKPVPGFTACRLRITFVGSRATLCGLVVFDNGGEDIAVNHQIPCNEVFPKALA